jgi:hypothetical protein
MAKRLAACISLGAVLAAVPAAAHARDVVRPSSVNARTTVPAGGSSTLTLRCPTASIALNAAVTRQGAGVTVRRSAPGGDAGDWSFRLTAAEGARRRGVSAVLRCLKLALPRGVSDVPLAFKTRNRPVVPVAPGASTLVRLGCGRAWTATGYGLDRGAGGDVRITSAVPTAHGWSFRLENLGLSPARAGLSVRCMRSEVSGSRDGAPATLRFRVQRPRFRNEVGSSADRGFSNACGRRQFSVATGVSFDPSDDIELGGAYPAGPWAGVWSFRQASGTQEVRSYLVCLSRRGQFRH